MGAISIPLFGFSSFFLSMIFSRTWFFFLMFIFFYSWRRRGMTFSPTYIFFSIFQGQLHHQFSLFHHLSIELRNHQECQMAHKPSENFPHQDDHHGIKYAKKLTKDALRNIFTVHSCHWCSKADEDAFEPKTFGKINCCGQPQFPNGKTLKSRWLRSYPL